MAKDKAKRPFAVAQAQAASYPERPKKLPRKGSYNHNRYDNFLGISQREVKATDELAAIDKPSRDRLYFYNPNRHSTYAGHKHVLKPAKRYRAP